jgi:plastocyanin
MHRSRPLAFAGVLTLLVTLAACSGGSGSPSAAASDGGAGGNTVSLSGARFDPATLTIAAGTTVTFTDTSGHTVTEGTNGTPVDDPIVDEQGGSDIEVTFDEPGTYHITCKIHSSMNMTITVEG